MELALHVRQPVEHLSRPLRVAQVEDFLDACLLLDHLDIGDVIIEAHISPGKHPVGVIVFGRERLMVPRVHRATIVSDPNVVPFINEKQVERSTSELVHPKRSIFEVAMLAEDGAL